MSFFPRKNHSYFSCPCPHILEHSHLPPKFSSLQLRVIWFTWCGTHRHILERYHTNVDVTHTGPFRHLKYTKYFWLFYIIYTSLLSHYRGACGQVLNVLNFQLPHRVRWSHGRDKKLSFGEVFQLTSGASVVLPIHANILYKWGLPPPVKVK